MKVKWKRYVAHTSCQSWIISSGSVNYPGFVLSWMCLRTTKEADFIAMIICDECGGSVSDEASVCPHCGFPLRRERTVPVEKTLKNLKLHAYLLLVAGAILLSLASEGDGYRNTPLFALILLPGIVFIFSSLVWIIVLGVRQWWNHG